MSANAGDVVMDFSFGDYVLYPNSFVTGTAKGYTKHYYAGSERIASRLVNCWHNNKQVDSLLSVEKTNISTALQMSNSQFDFTFKNRPAFMNYYSPDTVVDISGHSMANDVKFPVLKLAGYFKPEEIVSYNCENLASNECKSELFFTHSDHLGSSSWTTDANGRAIQHIEYLPFGEELLNQRATSYSERYTFTGKELDEESNLYYYDARYNSSTYSQFITVDPMSDKYPGVNPYLYCAGNPIKYIDPTGNDIWDLDKNGCVINITFDNNKDAFRMNGKEIDFKYGTILSPGKYGHTSMFLFKDNDAAIEAFKFLADNSFAQGSLVEYGLYATTEESILFTQNTDKHIAVGEMTKLIKCNPKFYGSAFELYHSHPTHLFPSGYKKGAKKGDKAAIKETCDKLGYTISAYVYFPKTQVLTAFDQKQYYQAIQFRLMNPAIEGKGKIINYSTPWTRFFIR